MLEENKSNAFLSKKLIRLDENVELGIEIDDLKVRIIEPKKLINFLENQGFRSLIYKVKKEFNFVEEANSQDLNSTQNNHSKELKNPNENKIRWKDMSLGFFGRKRFGQLLLNVRVNGILSKNYAWVQNKDRFNLMAMFGASYFF